MARTLARRPLRVPCDRARYLESDAMHETGAKIFATKLKRQSFEEDLAKIVRHHLRCLHDLVELAIGKCNRAHKVGDGGCSGGGEGGVALARRAARSRRRSSRSASSSCWRNSSARCQSSPEPMYAGRNHCRRRPRWTRVAPMQRRARAASVSASMRNSKFVRPDGFEPSSTPPRKPVPSKSLENFEAPRAKAT